MLDDSYTVVFKERNGKVTSELSIYVSEQEFKMMRAYLDKIRGAKIEVNSTRGGLK